MPVLHLIRNPGEGFGWDLLRHQAGTDAVTVVLLQAAIRMTPPPGLATFALLEGGEEWRERPGVQPIDTPGLVQLLERHDRAIVW